MREHKRNVSSTDLELIGLVEAIRHFRPYLQGTRFKIQTDNKNLTSKKLTASKNMTYPRLKRIIEVLNEMEVEFEWIPASQNVIADTLSRQTSEEGKEEERLNCIIEEAAVKNKFLNAQRNDKEIKGIRKILKNEKLDESYSGLEKRRIERMSRRCAIDKKKIVCVKKYNRGELKLLEKLDNAPKTGGHLGMHLTYVKIADRLYWKNVQNDIKEFVKSCPQCQLYKKNHVKLSSIKERKEDAKRVMYKLYIDTCGPFKYRAKDYHLITG